MLGRRQFLAGAIAATSLAASWRSHAASLDGDEIPIWPGPPPGGEGPEAPIVELPRGAVRRIATPTLRVFRPEKSVGCAVLIAPGGGYKRIEIHHEGHAAAQWFADRGVTAFVLTYRLPSEGWDVGPLAPLQDAQRALRLVRSRARQFEVDAERIGVVGFSAGGHLMGMLSARSDLSTYKPVDGTDRLSARPHWAALIYPVISLLPPDDRTSARRLLVGDNPSEELAAEWSVQTHITHDCPPIFSIAAKDDPIAGEGHLRLLSEACERAGVPDRMIRLENGGHGFSMGRPGTASEHWPNLMAEWLRERRALL
ncbi:alpha/beta hydrolase [Rhizobium oryzicola]|uniref:Alpha/beta hydrolase n=1 Tax=Rhizobium oryzicola TaxID=1232668 RepID=A0ABT8SZG9_9HYPH|nr:alpha/beta hydrolase [Rhizobium oryzicola]MDO1583875.1 alpha/beta hydrolase [Rhizobium oryzicola]